MSPAGQTWGILWFLQRVKDNSEHEAVCGFLNSRAPHHLLPRRAFAELFLKAETLKDWKDWKDCRKLLSELEKGWRHTHYPHPATHFETPRD